MIPLQNTLKIWILTWLSYVIPLQNILDIWVLIGQAYVIPVQNTLDVWIFLKTSTKISFDMLFQSSSDYFSMFFL